MPGRYRSVTDAGYVSGRMTTLPIDPVTTPKAALSPAPTPASPWRALRGMNLGDRLYRVTLTALALVLALLLAVPLALGVAIYLTEFSPKWLRQPIAFLVELLAAIPSVVYGLWGIF